MASPARKPLPSPAGAFDPENLTEADLDLLAANKRVRSGIQSRMGREGLAKRKAAEAARKALTHAGSPA